jgi:hypothetical protein
MERKKLLEWISLFFCGFFQHTMTPTGLLDFLSTSTMGIYVWKVSFKSKGVLSKSD